MSKRYPRVDQLLVSLGYGTRKEVQRWIKEKRVTRIDQGPLKEDDRVEPTLLRFDGAPLDHPEGIMIALNKPLGYVCSHSDGEGRLIYELIPQQWLKRDPKITTIGRLDKDTSGLIILTDQTHFVHQWTSPKHHLEKVYQVVLRDEIEPRLVDLFSRGELMLHGETKPCLPAKLTIISSHSAELTLTEGKYHQVRRMFAACGNFVVKLHRLKFGQLSLDGINEGDFRFINPNEVES